MTDWRTDMRMRVDAEIRVRRAIVQENEARLVELEEIQREFWGVPNWARDPFNAGAYSTCPDRGAFHEVVRPGKTQPTCECETVVVPLRGRVS